MRARALDTKTRVALAAIFFSGSCTATPILCDQTREQDSVQMLRWQPLGSSNAGISGNALDDGTSQAPGCRATARIRPQPGSLALLGVGLIGAALSHRFKRTWNWRRVLADTNWRGTARAILLRFACKHHLTVDRD
jgi:hypothetical protein